MRYVVRSAAGYYQNVNLRPRWVEEIKDAKRFLNVRAARDIVKILSRNRIDAKVIRIERALSYFDVK
jgi:hypothetical protein